MVFEMDRKYVRKDRGLLRSGGATDKQFSFIENWVREKAKELNIEPHFHYRFKTIICLKMLSPKIIQEINYSLTNGGGVFLLWKENKIYKIYEHYKHLDPEGGLPVCLGGCLLTDFNKLKNGNPRPSNRNPKCFIAYVHQKI